MGAELGATTTVFPSDEVTRAFFKAQGREDDWSELKADPDAEYDEELTIDLSALHPLTAMPHSPDNVARVADKAGIKIDQVAIGSCTNSSYADMMKVAEILDGHTVAPVSYTHLDVYKRQSPSPEVSPSPDISPAPETSPEITENP